MTARSSTSALHQTGFGAGRVAVKPPVDLAAIRMMAENGASLNEVARAFRRSSTTIRYHCDRNGIVFGTDGRSRNGSYERARNPSGSGAQRVGAVGAHEAEIRRLAGEGYSAAEIGDHLGLGLQSVYDLARRKGFAIGWMCPLPPAPDPEPEAAPDPLALASVSGLARLSPADRWALAMTGGRWRDLDAWATERGKSHRQAQALWHLTGQTVSRGQANE